MYRRSLIAAALLLTLPPVGLAEPLGTTISYQGQLEESGAPANGVYDVRMVAFDSFEFGNQVSPIVLFDDVDVLGGLVQLEVDFGAGVFIGERRWVQIEVRDGGSTGSYTPLMPRQEILPGAHALQAENAKAINHQEIEVGTIGTCTSDGSATFTGSMEFARAFASPPRVFLTPDETFNDNGCVTVRVIHRSATGFGWRSYGTAAHVACDCIHWMAIGER